MMTIKDKFEAQGTPIEARDIRVGDAISAMNVGETGFQVFLATNDDVGGVAEWDVYRLLHRPTPVPPTTPGSILVHQDRRAHLVLTPKGEWYGTRSERYYETHEVHEWLYDGTYILLLDAGATK